MTASETTGTATLIPIGKLRLQSVQKVIRDAIEGDLDADAIAEFLASVDWSGVQSKSLKVMPVLGQLEQWDSEYSEGDITRPQYKQRLQSLLSEDKQRKPAYTRAIA